MRRPPIPEVIAYISGYIAFKFINKLSCANCQKILKKDTTTTAVIKFKTIKNAILTEPTELLTNLVAHCEAVFNSLWLESFLGSSVVSRLRDSVNFLDFPKFSCHPELKRQIMEFFLTLRVRQQCKLICQWLKRNKRSK